MPCMKFLFVGSDVCRRLPSDSTSRWTPLPWAIAFPLLGWLGDLHPLDNAHAERTTPLVPLHLAGAFFAPSRGKYFSLGRKKIFSSRGKLFCSLGDVYTWERKTHPVGDVYGLHLKLGVTARMFSQDSLANFSFNVSPSLAMSVHIIVPSLMNCTKNFLDTPFPFRKMVNPSMPHEPSSPSPGIPEA